jgi:inosine triphosphate pyrophosphatase
MKHNRVIFVTGNCNKLKEVQDLMGNDIIIEARALDLPEFQGEPLHIASRKCLTAYEEVKMPVIVEDTGLCFNAYGGLPGPYIKWFLEQLGPSGLFKMLDGFEDKSGYARCIFAYFDGAHMDAPVLFDGRCNGRIVQPRGSTHFGWDPIFQPDGYCLTYSEMDMSEKGKISHRGKAFRLLKEYLLSPNNRFRAR